MKSYDEVKPWEDDFEDLPPELAMEALHIVCGLCPCEVDFQEYIRKQIEDRDLSDVAILGYN